MLTKCFTSKDEDVDIQFKRWQRRFNKAIHPCFMKVRIQPDKIKEQSKMDNLLALKKVF